jgi:hypothetical protein
MRVLGAEKFCVILFPLVTVSQNCPSFDHHSKQDWIGHWATYIRMESLGCTAVGAINLFESGVLRHPEQFVMGHSHG